jgi:hypothetical protein
MFDARLGLELNEGYAITFLFATENVVATWPPMYLPNLPRLKEKVRNEMDSPEIGVNFAFRDGSKALDDAESPVTTR